MHRRTLVLAAIVWAAATAVAQPLKFDFGSGASRTGWTRVTPDLAYDDARGFGFEGAPGVVPAAFSAGGDLAKGGGVKASAPFFFSFKVPAEGNWRVTVILGGVPSAASLTTISAEIRR